MEAFLLLADTSLSAHDIEESARMIEDLRKRNPDAAGYHLALGTLARLRRDLAGAESELQAARRLDPNSAAVYGELANVALDRREPEKAREALKRAAELSPTRSPLPLRYANYLIKRGADAEAKTVLDGITAKAPDYLPAWITAMQLAARNGRHDEILADAEKILAHDNVNYDALMERASVRLEDGDADGAIADLQRLAGFFKRAPEISYQLALAYLKKDDLVHAEENLSQAILLAPHFDEAILQMAELDLRKGNPTAAINSLTQLVQRRPSLGRASFLLAQAYREEGHVDLALAIFRHLATAFPHLPTGSYLAGMACLELNRTREARESLEEAVQIEADYWPAEEMLVLLDLAGNRPGAAADRVAGLLKKYPKAVDPWLLRARIRLVGGDEAGAEADLLHAIEINPKSEFAYLQLARLYVSANQAGKALDKLNAFAGRTGDVAALMQVGMIHTAQNDYEAARQTYERLLAIDPHFGPALNNLAMIYSERLSQFDKAYALAKRAQDLAPTDPVVADTLGWILSHQGKYEEALPLLEESARTAPAEAEIRYHLGMTYYLLGRETPAQAALQAAVTAGANARWTEDARRHLAILQLDPATAGTDVRSELERRAHEQSRDPVVRARLAAIELRAGDPTQAAADYEVALTYAPHSVPILLALVQLYSGPVPQYRRAQDLAKQAHEIVPSDGEVSLALGRALRRTGDYSWSLDLLQQAAQALPGRDDLAYDLALAYACASQVPEAEATLQPILRADAALAQREAAQRLAAILSALRHPAEIATVLPSARQLLAADPGNMPAAMVCAQAQEMQGDYPGAALAYERILAKDPVFALAARQLAFLYADRLGSDLKAEEMATLARPSFPNDARLDFELGVIHFRRSDFAAAVRFLQQSLQEKGDRAETIYYLGMSHYQLKDTAEAKDELQRAIDLNLGGPEAEQAKRVLGEMERSIGEAEGAAQPRVN